MHHIRRVLPRVCLIMWGLSFVAQGSSYDWYSPGNRDQSTVHVVPTAGADVIIENSMGSPWWQPAGGDQVGLSNGPQRVGVSGALHTYNSSAHVHHGDATAPVLYVGPLRAEVNGAAGEIEMGVSLGRLGCWGQIQGGQIINCSVRIKQGSRRDLLDITAGDSWDIRESGGILVTGYDQEREGPTSLTVTDSRGAVIFDRFAAINLGSWRHGLRVVVPDSLVSLEAAGTARTWATELHMDSLLFANGERGGEWGPAPRALVTVDYPDGEISLNSGQTWVEGHTERVWDNFDGTGWLGLRARTTLTTPGEYLGTLHLTVDLL